MNVSTDADVRLLQPGAAHAECRVPSTNRNWNREECPAMNTHVIENEYATQPREAIRESGRRGTRIGTTRSTRLGLGVAVCALLCVPAVGHSAGDASALATKYNCQACHALDAKGMGPSYKDIAAKYA